MRIFLSIGCAMLLGTLTAAETIVFQTHDDQTLSLDLHLPENLTARPFPTILWIHGGGWRQGSRENWKVLEWLPSRDFAVVAIDYRLTDVAPFPAQIDDCRAALEWLKKESPTYHLDTERVFTAGLSAGAQLATLLAVTNESNAIPVRGTLHFYGPSDFISMSKYAKQPTAPLNTPGNNVYELLDGPLIERLALAKTASPVTHLDSSDPPLLIIVGSEDTLMTQRQCEHLADTASKHGVSATFHKIEGVGHGGSAKFWDDKRQNLILNFLQSSSP